MPLLKRVAIGLSRLGFNPRVLASYRHFFRYRREKKEWLAKGGEITKNYMILRDYSDKAGTTKGHYFHQDLLVANFVFEESPARHIDIGSRIDGFVSHVASFRKIEVIDIRPLPKSEHKNIQFTKADLMNPQSVGESDSVSCLHAIEHFGLGRYTDDLDVNGHVKGVDNLVELVSSGGTLYISFPIGKGDEVHFNAHRVFHPKTLLEFKSIKEKMKLKRFDYVDDFGDLHQDSSPDIAVDKVSYGCGIYTFEKR